MATATTAAKRREWLERREIETLDVGSMTAEERIIIEQAKIWLHLGAFEKDQL